MAEPYGLLSDEELEKANPYGLLPEETSVSQVSIAQRAIETKLRNEAAKVPSKKDTANWLLENLCLTSPQSEQQTTGPFSEQNIKEASAATSLGTSSFISSTPSGIDEYSKLVIKRTTAAYHAFSTPVEQPTNGTSSQKGSLVNKKVGDYSEGTPASLEDWSNAVTPKLAEALKPNPLGGIVDTATGVVKDSMGALQLLPNKIIALVDKVTPDFSNQLDSAFKAINVEALAHLPSKIMGSLRNLATALDQLLSVPFELLSDMYNGLLDIMNAIADLVDSLMASVMNILQKIIFQILDSILPLDEIMSFLDAINEVASFLGDLGSMLGGFNVVSDLTNQVTGFSSQFSTALQDPLGTALAYVPGAQQGLGQITGGVSQITGALRNPQQVLTQFLPPGVSDQLSNISQFPGLGFVGNLGYSVGNTFDTLSDSFFTKALSQFSSQLPILGPLFNKQSGDEPTLTDITAPGQQSFNSAAENPNIQIGTGNTVQIEDTSSYKIFSEKNQQQAINQINTGTSMGIGGGFLTPAMEKPWLRR